MEQNEFGIVRWADLTVPDAVPIRDFYSAVVGWEPDPVDMGGYNDWNMQLPGAEAPAAGICNARGANAAIPPQWVVYITVPDVQAAVDAAVAHGGAVVDGPREGFCLLRDPAGAVFAVWQPEEE